MLKFRRGDTHSIYFEILDRGAPYDLTGATAVIHAQQGKNAPINLTAVVEAAERRIRHDLTGALAIGTYAYEIELLKDGKILTAPTQANGTFTVIDDIS